MVTADDALVRDPDDAAHRDDAFARRSDAYLGQALGLAYYIVGDLHEAEDATQEAMARAWKSRRSLRAPEAFEAWLDRIVVNTCREKLRRKKAADRFSALFARDAVGRALAALTVDQRTVVVLRYWRDLSLDQIAQRLGWPIGTVKSRLHYGLAALRERLEQDETEVRQ
jgi:DNA-directed RNA polymerase specialized sigma24 family protein